MRLGAWVRTATSNRVGPASGHAYIVYSWLASALPAERPVGTVVFFHGCARLSNSFFPYHPTVCPECIGLPEELALTKQAGHRRGWEGWGTQHWMRYNNRA